MFGFTFFGFTNGQAMGGIRCPQRPLSWTSLHVVALPSSYTTTPYHLWLSSSTLSQDLLLLQEGPDVEGVDALSVLRLGRLCTPWLHLRRLQATLPPLPVFFNPISRPSSVAGRARRWGSRCPQRPLARASLHAVAPPSSSTTSPCPCSFLGTLFSEDCSSTSWRPVTRSSRGRPSGASETSVFGNSGS